MTQRISDSSLNYNGKDAFITLECHDKFMEELDRPAFPGMNSFRDTYTHTLELLEPCMYMQGRGIKVDREALKQEQVNIADKIVELNTELNLLVGHDINFNSPAQIQQYFYVEKGITPFTKYNKDKGASTITTDDKALQKIARGTVNRPGMREAVLIQELRKLSKLKGTYLDMTFDKDDRMRSSYNPRGTRFARLSSGQTIFGTGGNAQNLHPSFLSFLVADPGCIFVSLDKRQAEWVAMAYVTGDMNMINAVKQGVDVHAYTASKMFHKDIDLIKEEESLIGHESDVESIKRGRVKIPELLAAMQRNDWLPRTMSMRQCGKKSNHGLNYDESYKMFALVNEITEKEAKVIVDFYHQTYRGIRSYYDFVKGELNKNGRVLQNLFGRPYRFLGGWNKDLWKSAYSFRAQSTIGELVNRAIVDTYNSTRPELQDLEILQQVHDNILFQLPLNSNELGEAIRTCKRYLEPCLSYGGREFIIETDMKVGLNLKDMIECDLVSAPDKQAEIIRTTISDHQTSRGLDHQLS